MSGLEAPVYPTLVCPGRDFSPRPPGWRELTCRLFGRPGRPENHIAPIAHHIAQATRGAGTQADDAGQDLK